MQNGLRERAKFLVIFLFLRCVTFIIAIDCSRSDPADSTAGGRESADCVMAENGQWTHNTKIMKAFISDDCKPPLLHNGHVDGSGSSSSWTGSLSCLPSFTLVGNSKVKCREGQWSGDIPVCTKLEGCDPGDLPGVKHGRKYSYANSRYRGGVYKYSCYKGYHLVGSNIVWCDEGRWSVGEQETVCASE